MPRKLEKGLITVPAIDNVVPRKLEKGLIIVPVIDNVVYDLSSATAKCFFHGTSISVYQRSKSNLPHNKFVYENKMHTKFQQFLR